MSEPLGTDRLAELRQRSLWRTVGHKLEHGDPLRDEEVAEANNPARRDSWAEDDVAELLAELERLQASLNRVDEILKTNITYMETDGSKAPEEMWRLLGN